MGRNPRVDEPGTWHHVMNRGIARRSLFERRDDVRYFLACLARAVRRGQVEVHAWCILTTHFHLLVRSPVGELSAAMQRVQNDYVRWFNRGRKRDGPLVRGRFRSRLVTSVTYRALLVRYIDANPVEAGLAPDPCRYPYGSASAYARQSGPPWLTRMWVEDLVCRHLGLPAFDPAGYSRAVAADCPSAVKDLVERRIIWRGRVLPEDPLDDLVAAAPPAVLRWLRAKARLADGGAPGLPVADARSVRQALAATRNCSPAWSVSANRTSRCGWEVLEVGLLRDLTAATFEQVAGWVGCDARTAARIHAQHGALLHADPDYGAVGSQVARLALDGLARLFRPAAKPTAERTAEPGLGVRPIEPSRAVPAPGISRQDAHACQRRNMP